MNGNDMNPATKYLTLTQRKKYVEALKKEPKLKLSEIYTFDIDNLSKDERDLLILESEVFNEELRQKNHYYNIKNRDYHREYNKEYYTIEKWKKNRESLKEKYPDHYVNKTECKVCGGMYVPVYLRNHLSSKKHLVALRNIPVKEDAHFLE